MLAATNCSHQVRFYETLQRGTGTTYRDSTTWFYDFWRRNGWDGESEVWRVEFRYRREALHEMGVPGVFEGIEDVYDLVERLEALWVYAAGHAAGGPDGLPDGWLRYVIPGSD